jgi:NAD(P)H-flavin reductase
MSIKILGKDGEMYAFSIANPPSDNYEIILYIRCYKGNYDLTKFYSCLNDYIFISGPYGRCIYNPSSFRLPIFIAQGIGITAFQAFFQQYKIKGELIWLKKKTDLSFHRNIIEIYKKKNNDFSVHYFFSDIEYDSINFLISMLIIMLLINR